MNMLKFALAVSLVAASASVAMAARSAADQALYEKAVAACNGPNYPSGAHPYINYAGGWFRCVEPRDR